MGIVNSKFIYSTTGTAALAAAVLYYYFIRPISDRRANGGDKTLVLGLKNFGYTCYLNSILQALASCDHFADWIRINNDLSSGPILESNSHSSTNGKSQSKSCKLSLNRAAFPIVAVLHQSFILINRVIRGDDNVHSSQVPGEVMKIFNRVLDDKYKSECRTACNKFRLIDTEEQDTHEVFNHLMSNLSDQTGSEISRSYERAVKTLIADQKVTTTTGTVGNGTVGGRALTKDSGGTGDTGTQVPQVIIPNPQSVKDSNRNFLKTKIDLEDGNSLQASLGQPNSFQGTTGSQLQCISCFSRHSIQIESFSSVSLNLPQYSCGTVSIYELLESYTKPIIVHSVDCDSCTKSLGCETKSSFYRKSAFAKLPSTLCIHILRTEWRRDGTSYKRKEHVRFPIRLNLTDLLRVNDIRSTENKKKSERKQHRRTDEGGEYMEGSARFRNSQYGLRSIVSHRGDVDSGHFVTYRRSPKNEDGEEVWLLVSDMMVVPVSLEEVLTAKAYMLFYEKLDFPSPDVSGHVATYDFITS